MGTTNPSLKSTQSKSPLVKIPKYNIVVLGEGGVGKSAITFQFVSHRFPDHLDATIGRYFIISCHF